MDCSFLNHSLLSSDFAFLNNKIYFIQHSKISYYDLDSKSVFVVREIKSPGKILFLKSTPCLLNGNVLLHDSEVLLRDIPLRTISINKALGFLHSDGLEIYNGTKLIFIELKFNSGELLLDLCQSPDSKSTYILTTVALYSVPDLFKTQFCLPLTRLSKFVGFTRIYSSSFLYLCSDSTVSKYDSQLNHLYSFTPKCEYKMVGDFCLGDSLVYMGKAPFLVSSDRILAMQLGQTHIGISNSRIYYLTPQIGSNSINSIKLMELPNETTINENTIKREVDHPLFIKNEVTLLKYETLLKKAHEISKEVDSREHELKFQYKKLGDTINELKEKERKLLRRIDTLIKRAQIVVGDTTEFQRLIGKLEGMMDTSLRLDSGLLKILKIQRASLKSKLTN